MLLLEKLNLTSYMDVFSAEQINGEVLTMCDEEVLAADLGVSSKLHRLRLLRIIQGRQSVRELLNNITPTYT